MSYMHVVLRGTFVPHRHMDLRLFSNILVFEQVMRNEIVDSSMIALRMEMILTYLKVNLDM